MLSGSPMNKMLLQLSDTEILALTISGEARGSTIEEQVAVGCVTRNRLHRNPAKYQDYADVCLEEKQFSCWNTDDPNYKFLIDLAAQITKNAPPPPLFYKQCVWIASGIINWNIIDNTGSALNYLTKELYNSPKRPSWADKVTHIESIGKSLFFSV